MQLGEIHTGLLQNSAAANAEMARRVLAVIPRQLVRTWERPIQHAESAEFLTGLDCMLPSAVRTRVRAVGTVITQGQLTGGRVLQASTRTTLVHPAAVRRMPWSYYLARPGQVEPFGRMGAEDVAAGFLHEGSDPQDFDLGGVSARWMSWIQGRPELDRRAPFAAARTRLRWVATVTAEGEAGRIEFEVQDSHRRTMMIKAPRTLVDRLPALCLDLALHDWLLSVLVSMVELAGVGRRPRVEVVGRLGPAIDHLLHLWMPAARLDDELVAFWDELDRRGGLGRQWQSLVRQVRDQVLLGSVIGSGAGAGAGQGSAVRSA